MKLRLAFFCMTVLLSLNAFAIDGSSGCGPGWYILKDDSLVSSSLRTTTHGILFPVVTFGMTFGTSNCTQHKLVLTEKQSLHFATMNHYELKRDMATGRGEYLSAFATTMGCPASVQGRLNENLRANYGKIYRGDADPQGVLLEVYKTIFSDADLTAKCSLGQV